MAHMALHVLKHVKPCVDKHRAIWNNENTDYYSHLRL